MLSVYGVFWPQNMCLGNTCGFDPLNLVWSSFSLREPYLLLRSIICLLLRHKIKLICYFIFAIWIC